MLELQWDFQSLIWFLNQCSVYLSIQLGRCVLFSFVVLGIVIILRCSILKEKIFLKGMLWSIFLLVPFVGKLELFYYNTLMCRLFLWWHNCCCEYPAIGYSYLFGVVISGILIFWRHRELYQQIENMERGTIGDNKIYISQMPVTPFTIGVFHSKVVVPKVMKDTFEAEELQTVLLHERTHIRLGHLWFYLLWDILRMLLWLNPLLTYCMRYFKEDMEDICDRVTIQKGDSTAYEYGQILLKSIKLLKAENVGMYAAFVGEKDYKDLKHRFTKVAEYKPYRTLEAVVLCIACMLFLIGMFTLIKQVSFPRYTEAGNMRLVNESGKQFVLYDNAILQKAVHVDGGNICIDKKIFQNVLEEYGIDDSMESFWLSFGGYLKMPGIGGTPNLVYVNYGGLETELIIPYENREENLFEFVYKNLP